MGRLSSIAPRDYRVNEQIRIREVRVIGESGEQLDVLPIAQALQMARERNLDLVEVAPTASPPVCRLMDYGRFRFLQAKREREVRKTQKTNLLHEIRFRPRIASHDREAKLRRIREFLEEGAKVKLTVMFRGREITHPEIGVALLRSIAENVKDQAKLEAPPAMEGRRMNVVLNPVARRDGQTEKPASEEETIVAQEAQEVQT